MPLWCVDSWDILLKVSRHHLRFQDSYYIRTYVIILTDAVAFSSAHFGAGAGPIHLDHVACSGSEDNLIDCSHSSFVSCSGGHREDAGVRCQGGLICVTVQIPLQCIRCCLLY